MIRIYVVINNALHAIGLARWRLQAQPAVVDGKKTRVASIVTNDAERMARLRYPGDNV